MKVLFFSFVKTFTLACATLICVLLNLFTGAAAAMVVEVKSTTSLRDAKRREGPRQLRRHYEELKEVCQEKNEAGNQNQAIRLKMCMALPECATPIPAQNPGDNILFLNKPTLETEAELQAWLKVGRNMKSTAYYTDSCKCNTHFSCAGLFQQPLNPVPATEISQ
jgi:hypothetical protein